MRRSRWTAALACAVLFAAPAGAAPPQSPPPIEGVVVKVADGEVIIDLGTARGVPPGASLRLFRRMVVEHPITKATIEDRFPIGTVTPAQVGSLLSIVRDVTGLERPPVPGDFAVYRPAPVAPVAEAVAKAPAPSAQAPARPEPAPDVAALEATFTAALGQPLPERIALFEAFVASFPQSVYVDPVGREIASLRGVLRDVRRAEHAAAERAEAEADRVTVLHASPRPIVAGEGFEVAIALLEPERVAAVRLLSARDPDATWTTREMARDGDYYFRAALPAVHLAEPGEVRYVVEVARPDGRLQQVVGRTETPERLVVEPVPPGEQPPGDSHLEVVARYVDFDSVGDSVDRYFQFETSFTYDLGWHVLRAVRIGIGLIDGEGGPTDAIDAGEASRAITLNYAFAEAEVEVGQWVGIAGRLIGGNTQATGDDPRSAMTGLEARLRLGRFDETRFVAGVSVLDVLGAQGFLDAHIAVFERAPMRLGVVVTNLPVDADLGVQIEYAAGWRVLDWLTITAEVGWNARTINHYGFTGGGGLALDW